MTQLQRIHPQYEVYFRTLGNTVQTRVTQISPKTYTQKDKIIMVEPGRTIIVGDMREELTRLFDKLGKPALNKLTSSPGRDAGIFSTRSYASMMTYLYGDNAPRTKPERPPKNGTSDLAVT